MAHNNRNELLEPFHQFISQMDNLLSEKTGNGLLQSMDGFFQNQKLFSSFPMEWEETDTHYIIHAHIAGVDKQFIEIDISGSRLTISYETEERRPANHEKGTPSSVERRKKARSFSFTEPIDEENIQATHENGLLTVSVPKSKKKRISIR
ncbi:Hsp20/alpha crystallin family protein [Gracilibacillus sp. Marseille-QA3620]